jgi:hypothetical protein
MHASHGAGYARPVWNEHSLFEKSERWREILSNFYDKPWR